MADPATFFTYYITGTEYSTHFEPATPQYKQLKNGMIISLTRMIISFFFSEKSDQNGNVITDGPRTTVVLHIQ